MPEGVHGWETGGRAKHQGSVGAALVDRGSNHFGCDVCLGEEEPTTLPAVVDDDALLRAGCRGLFDHGGICFHELGMVAHPTPGYSSWACFIDSLVNDSSELFPLPPLPAFPISMLFIPC